MVHNSAPVTPDGTFGVTFARAAVAVFVVLPGILGLAMIAWFIVSLTTPTKVKVAVGNSPDVFVASYGGQLYVLICSSTWSRSRRIPWEEPWGLRPTVWEPEWGIGNDPWSATRWFAGSLPLLAIVPLLPSVAWTIWGSLRSRRLRRFRGFALDADDHVAPPAA